MSKEKTKLLIVIRHPVGGIRTYLKYTYKYIDPEKYNITILTVRNPEGIHIRTDLDVLSPHMIEVDANRPEINLVIALIRLLNTHKFDLIHSQGFTAGILSVLANLLFKVPHVITSHDVLRSDQFGPPFFAYLKSLIYEKLLGAADIIQSVSFDAEANLLEFLPGLARKRSKLKVILNGIDISNFTTGHRHEASLKKELNINPGVFVFGFLGRFMPQKGFDYLLNAVEILSRDPLYSEKFIILAVNDGAFVREYKDLIAKQRLSKYFVFNGFVPQVKQILERIDALVMPSLWEAYGLIAAEALLVGCPVIASDCIGLREVVRDTPSIVARHKNSQSLAESLKLFMDGPDAIRKETSNYIPFARIKYDSRKTARELDSLFQCVMNQ